MSLVVLKPGPLSLFQDDGRHGYQAYGAPVCGVMDAVAYRLANALVGNRQRLPVLEMTLSGPRLLFMQDACIAVCGSAFAVTRDATPLALNRPHLIRAGQVLEIGPAAMPAAVTGGARACLAMHGGIALPLAMESASTDTKSRMGGIQGRALAKGDRLTLNHKLDTRKTDALQVFLDDYRIHLPAGLGLGTRARISVMPGAHWSHFGHRQQARFLETTYTVSANSDRMGYRLSGASLQPDTPLQILSEPTAFGTIQVPPDGQPIILMADRQTTGGYPKIANVASVDLPILARCLPGQQLSFARIEPQQAHARFLQREALFQQLQLALAPLADRLVADRAASD